MLRGGKGILIVLRVMHRPLGGFTWVGRGFYEDEDEGRKKSLDRLWLDEMR